MHFYMLLRDIIEEEENVNNELFQKYIKFKKPSLMQKVLRNNDFVNIIKSDLKNLKDDIKIMSKNEKKKRIKQSDKVLDIVEDVLEFINGQNQEEKY